MNPDKYCIIYIPTINLKNRPKNDGHLLGLVEVEGASACPFKGSEAFLTKDLSRFDSKLAETILTGVRETCQGGQANPSISFPPTGYIQASRALMIASIVFGSFGIVATLSGMQCSKIGGENYLLKGRIAAIGGVFFLLQGNGAGPGGA